MLSCYFSCCIVMIVCYGVANAGPDSLDVKCEATVDSIQALDESIFDSFVASHDSGNLLLRTRETYRSVNSRVYSRSFWEALCRDVHFSEVTLSVESWSYEHGAYNAYAVVMAESNYYYACWANSICMKGGDFRDWHEGDQVFISSRRVPVDSVSLLLDSLVKKYKVEEIRFPILCSNFSSLNGFTLVWINGFGVKTNFLMINSLESYELLSGYFDELFDLLERRCDRYKIMH